MSYKECWELQQTLFEEQLRKQNDNSDEAGVILFVEHPAVYTLGKSGKMSNMLISEEYLRSLGAEFYHIDRGGDITFHGEGQVVCYPILDIAKLGIGLRRYIDILEESVIATIAHYGIRGRRLDGATGVWLADEVEANGEVVERNWRKICAIGVKASRFVTMHGLALNASTDLRWFTMINPCGFTDKGVTSLTKECGREIGYAEVSELLAKELLRVLDATEGATER